MTSSLVGSEMCIRDRLTTFHHVLKQVDDVLRNLEHADASLEVMCVHVIAVSYTHLTLPTICSV
eukprot:5278983-Prorocentrum_lima.AAC.1